MLFVSLLILLYPLNTNTVNILFDEPYYHREILIQSDLEETLRYIQNQFKRNAKNKNRIDLKGSKLIIYDNDGGYCEYNLNVIAEIKSEYDSGKYYLKMEVHSKSTFLERDEINVIYCYDAQGSVTKTVGIGIPFNTFQNATLTRDAIRKLKKIINS